MSEAPEDLTGAPELDPTPELSTEDRARGMGWKPQEEYGGDAKSWVDAETFVKRGDEILPFVQSHARKLEQALAKAETRANKLEQTLARFSEHHTKTEQRAYERALSEVQGKIAASAAVGDVAGVQAGTSELVDLTQKAQDPEPAQAAEDPEWFAAWKADNDWFGKDKIRSAAAGVAAQELLDEGYTGKALALEVDKRLKAEFPHKYENLNRRNAASVEAGGVRRPSGGKSYADLPSDAKAACDEFVKGGLLTRDQYVKEYQW